MIEWLYFLGLFSSIVLEIEYSINQLIKDDEL